MNKTDEFTDVLMGELIKKWFTREGRMAPYYKKGNIKIFLNVGSHSKSSVEYQPFIKIDKGGTELEFNKGVFIKGDNKPFNKSVTKFFKLL